jgi:predicted HicB family RNase H-like nuclease
MTTLDSKIIKWSRQFYDDLCIGEKRYLNELAVLEDISLGLSKIFSNFTKDLQGNVNKNGEIESKYINEFCSDNSDYLQRPLLIVKEEYVDECDSRCLSVRAHEHDLEVESILNDCIVEYIESCGLKVVDYQ